MSEDMHCSMWVDFVRECGMKIGFMPEYTYEYCSTEKFIECPFYRTIKNIGYHCKYLEKCPAYEHFQIGDFHKFVLIAHQYCLSETNNCKCERFKLRESGETPPPDLLPSGEIIKEIDL